MFRGFVHVTHVNQPFQRFCFRVSGAKRESASNETCVTCSHRVKMRCSRRAQRLSWLGLALSPTVLLFFRSPQHLEDGRFEEDPTSVSLDLDDPEESYYVLDGTYYSLTYYSVRKVFVFRPSNWTPDCPTAYSDAFINHYDASGSELDRTSLSYLALAR